MEIKEINSHILKLTGRAELPQEIELGDNYHVSLEGSIESYSLHDNHDGTYNKMYTFKPVKIDVLDHKGKALKLKDPRSNSTKVRNYLWKIWFEEGVTEDFDACYDAFTQAVMFQTPNLLREAIKRINEKDTSKT